MPAAVAARPPKPSTAAIKATMKNPIAQRNMPTSLGPAFRQPLCNRLGGKRAISRTPYIFVEQHVFSNESREGASRRPAQRAWSSLKLSSIARPRQEMNDRYWSKAGSVGSRATVRLEDWRPLLGSQRSASRAFFWRAAVLLDAKR